MSYILLLYTTKALFIADSAISYVLSSNFRDPQSSLLSVVQSQTCMHVTIFFVVPVVHLEPLHAAVQIQVFGAVQIPPFGQDVTPEHSAETKCSINSIWCSII